MKTQLDMRDFVCLHAHDIAPDHPAAGLSKEFKWSLEPRFEISLLDDPLNDWAGRYEDMRDALAHNHKQHELAWLADEYFPYPTRMPVIVVLGTDDKYHLWDGNKRVAFTAAQGCTRLPALIGMPK